MKKYIILLSILLLTFGCREYKIQQSQSGIKAATVNISTGSDGLSIEQRNIKNRLLLDNKIGSIKHLYIISAMSGQVLIYSTVDGKVTSSSKRLSPNSIAIYNKGAGVYGGYKLYDGQITSEILEDDGTYGKSVPYIYWWDTRGIYHQHYISGGQILHISDQPLAVKNIILNMSQDN